MVNVNDEIILKEKFFGETKMQNRKGFTLIELMVVILIVGILAAVAIPLMRGRVDSAKWSEGKAMMGTIGTAIRAYAAEKGSSATLYGADLPTAATLGFGTSDLVGTYFSTGNFSWTTGYATEAAGLTFTITATAPAGIATPQTVTLNQAGVWTP
jgi:prepilin-type N-terminal cleavage/methylation domain-containing protein